MNQHVHYDLAAYEKQLRENFAPQVASPVDEFHRLQLLGSEVIVQFGVFLARLDNEGIGEDAMVETACALIASQIENLAFGFEGRRSAILADLIRRIAQYSFRGGEVTAVTDAPIIPGGHA